MIRHPTVVIREHRRRHFILVVIIALGIVQTLLVVLTIVFITRRRSLNRMSARDFPHMTEDRFSLWWTAQHRKRGAFMLVAGGLLVIWLVVLLGYFTNRSPGVVVKFDDMLFFLTAVWILVASVGLGYAYGQHKRARELERMEHRP